MHGLTRKRASRLVPEIHISDGQVATDPQAIADHFAIHYQTVYRTVTQYQESESDPFLRDITLPTLSKDKT